MTRAPGFLPARVVAGFVALVAFVALDRCYQWASEWRSRRRCPPPGELRQVRGRAVHLWRVHEDHAIEETKPAPRAARPATSLTVVVVTALGTPCLEWLDVARRLASSVAVVLYDRPGLGWSESPATASSVSTNVDILDEALEMASLGGPLVLVGHSLGGLIARLYAQRHRDRVAGLVLVEASHHDQLVHLAGKWRPDPARELRRWARRTRLRPLGLTRLLADLGAHRAPPAEGVPAGWEPALRAVRATRAAKRTSVAEMRELADGVDDVRHEAQPLGDLPLLVITAGPRGREGWWPAWDDLQRDYVAQSTRGRHLRLPHATHHAHHDDPAAVTSALRSFVHEVSTSPRTGPPP